MINIDRFTHARNIQNAQQPATQRRIVLQLPEIAFEQAVIGSIKAYERHKQPNIRFRQALAKQEWTFSIKLFLKHSKRLKYVAESFIIGDLRSGKSRAINAVVEPRINILVQLVDF